MAGSWLSYTAFSLPLFVPVFRPASRFCGRVACGRIPTPCNCIFQNKLSSDRIINSETKQGKVNAKFFSPGFNHAKRQTTLCRRFFLVSGYRLLTMSPERSGVEHRLLRFTIADRFSFSFSVFIFLETFFRRRLFRLGKIRAINEPIV